MKIRKGDHENFLTKEIFTKSLETLQKEKRKKYQFILKGGNSLRNALYHLFDKVMESEIIPEDWKKTTILQLVKGKSDFRDLKNMRNIHLKEETPKIFTRILMSQVKEKIMKNMTCFQTGTKPGHQPQEHVFLMMSMMSLYQMMKKPMMINYYDISKFFDKESLRDVLSEIHPLGIRGKEYRLLFRLNETRPEVYSSATVKLE